MEGVSQKHQKEHYNAVMKAGLIGGALGGTLGFAGVYFGSKRWSIMKHMTVAYKGFLVSSSVLVGGTILSENKSIEIGRASNPMNNYKDEAAIARELVRQQQTSYERVMEWGKENRYTIVFGSWIAAMGIALGIVGRSKYLSGAQKLVQARVYAQGLTVAVLIATAAFETADARNGESRWQTIKVLDPNDPERKKLIEKRIHKEEYEGQDLWKDMVAAEERRLAQLKQNTA